MIYLEGAKAAYFDQLIEQLADHDDSIAVPEISGVIKVDERTVDIRLKGKSYGHLGAGRYCSRSKHYYCEGEPEGELIKASWMGFDSEAESLGAGRIFFTVMRTTWSH